MWFTYSFVFSTYSVTLCWPRMIFITTYRLRYWLLQTYFILIFLEFRTLNYEGIMQKHKWLKWTIWYIYWEYRQCKHLLLRNLALIVVSFLFSGVASGRSNIRDIWAPANTKSTDSYTTAVPSRDSVLHTEYKQVRQTSTVVTHILFEFQHSDWL